MDDYRKQMAKIRLNSEYKAAASDSPRAHDPELAKKITVSAQREWRPGEQFVMGSAFLGLVDYLSRQPEALEAFKRDTGTIVASGSPFERMIDKATGHDRDIAMRFINWVKDNHWGEEIPPDLALDFGIET